MGPRSISLTDFGVADCFVSEELDEMAFGCCVF